MRRDPAHFSASDTHTRAPTHTHTHTHTHTGARAPTQHSERRFYPKRAPNSGATARPCSPLRLPGSAASRSSVSGR